MVNYTMVTKGNTKPILVYEGIADFLKETKIATSTSVWMLLEQSLTPEFIKKYNNWVDHDDIAKKQGYRKIERDDW